MSTLGNVLSGCLSLSPILGRQSSEQVCLAPWGSAAPIIAPDAQQALSA